MVHSQEVFQWGGTKELTAFISYSTRTFQNCNDKGLVSHRSELGCISNGCLCLSSRSNNLGGQRRRMIFHNRDRHRVDTFSHLWRGIQCRTSRLHSNVTRWARLDLCQMDLRMIHSQIRANEETIVLFDFLHMDELRKDNKASANPAVHVTSPRWLFPWLTADGTVNLQSDSQWRYHDVKEKDSPNNIFRAKVSRLTATRVVLLAGS